MIHILLDKKKNYYWLSIVRKGRGFEENGKSSESFTSKQNCEKSMKQEANCFASTGSFEVVDHTGNDAVFFIFTSEDYNGTWKKHFKQKVSEEEFEGWQLKEIEFVQNLKK